MNITSNTDIAFLSETKFYSVQAAHVNNFILVKPVETYHTFKRKLKLYQFHSTQASSFTLLYSIDLSNHQVQTYSNDKHKLKRMLCIKVFKQDLNINFVFSLFDFKGDLVLFTSNS